MKKILIFLSLIGILSACSKKTEETEKGMTHETLTTEQIQAIMEEVSAMDIPTINADELAVLETTLGKIVIEFDVENAPVHSANFKKLVMAGYYDGITFHRVIPGFMVQGGDINSRDDNPNNDGNGGPGYTIAAEIRNIHKRGVVAAARTGGSNNPERRSSGSQFYICHVDIPHLDGEYTAYGQVIEGLEVVDKIALVKTGPNNKPIEDVRINRAYMTTISEL